MKKLLDREPTPEMVDALQFFDRPSSVVHGFTAMWDAAPALPEPGEAEKWLRSKCYCDGGHRGTECIPCGAADLIAALQFQRESEGPLIESLRERAEIAEAELADIRDALAGGDAASLPNDYSTVAMAWTIRSDRDKFLWQVRDTCQRAEKAEAENERLREALGRIERHGPPMLASGDYRKGAEDMASTLSAIARAAIDAARKQK